MMRPVYLDYAASTPVDPRVAEKMIACLTMDGNFANPASRSHIYGWRAEEAVEHARQQVAELLNTDPRSIVWTSGATESNNLAIKGAAHQWARKGKHLITSRIEHKAVVDTFRHLEHEGYEITWLQPDADGLIHVQQVSNALRDDTILVSLMHVNNEIGTLTDIAAIGDLCREHHVLFHVDAAQSIGKLPIDLSALNVDLMSISAHKIYGPKGIGALYVRQQPKVRIEAQMHGGGHERGMRSGTLPTHQIVGMGEALRLAQELMLDESPRIAGYRQTFWEGIKDLPSVQLNGSSTQRISGNLNLAVAGVEGELLLMALKDLAISTGSACTSASVEPSYVLKAIGVPDALAHSSVRISFGRFTTEDEVEFAIKHFRQVVTRLTSTDA
ncbi:IscS subfamily cysteine desulfurase [Nitrincola tibetensis]|uniref:cysteine desulfurase n=1 Tax=Nitrincola tibetensis TaxID=2219697 RepID=A0A364NI31_9GAMM|nr:IscS subfamily cysteine desulfurase [Nitrincola tibetensis]RAU16704.1 IscS subfamily cysteine desulfurase [Nitrincola tibetensis]